MRLNSAVKMGMSIGVTLLGGVATEGGSAKEDAGRCCPASFNALLSGEARDHDRRQGRGALLLVAHREHSLNRRRGVCVQDERLRGKEAREDGQHRGKLIGGEL